MKKDNKIDRIFKALADPTRREILYLLVAAAAAMNINEVSDRFPATRQGVTKHLKVLEEAGLIQAETLGRERHLRLEPAGLEPARSYLDAIGQGWETALQSLKAHVEGKG